MEVLAGVVAAAAPLIYAVVGETITEKAGVVNLSLDGSIMLSAMVAFAAAATSGSVIVGFVAAMLVSMTIAGVVAFSAIGLRLNQIAVGFVLFLFAKQLALFFGDPYIGEAGPQVAAWDLPLLADIPWVGPVLFSHNLSVYGSFLAVIAAGWFLAFTRSGLELRAVGERPEAAHARGIPVNRIRYVATLVGGAFVGMAGAAVSARAASHGPAHHPATHHPLAHHPHLPWPLVRRGGGGGEGQGHQEKRCHHTPHAVPPCARPAG